jgi:hypothetical protein
MNCWFPRIKRSDEVVKTKHALVLPILHLSPHPSLAINLKMAGDTMRFGMEVGHALAFLQAHSHSHRSLSLSERRNGGRSS